MAVALQDPRVPIVYLSKFREYGISIDDGSVLQGIDYCPWCGEKLPDSLRDQFFEHLAGMGLELDSADLPVHFRSDAWWRLRSRG
jgi:uncharacterized protein DUF6980